METKTVKISTENYRRINEIAGELQKQTGKPISVDRTLTYILHMPKISDLAGMWKMSDKEAEEIFSSLRKSWKTWKTSA